MSEPRWFATSPYFKPYIKLPSLFTQSQPCHLSGSCSVDTQYTMQAGVFRSPCGCCNYSEANKPEFCNWKSPLLEQRKSNEVTVNIQVCCTDRQTSAHRTRLYCDCKQSCCCYMVWWTCVQSVHVMRLLFPFRLLLHCHFIH